MSLCYLFNTDGSCRSCVDLGDRENQQAYAQELATRGSAAAFILSDMRIRITHARLVNGVLTEVEPTVTAEQQWMRVRTQRQLLLLGSDWTQLPDVPLETKAVWATYRQALRDITDQSDPFNITWPQSPSN